MNIKRSLEAFMSAITEEADRNPRFAQKLAVALDLDKSVSPPQRQAKKRGGRRNPAVFDPVTLCSEKNGELQKKLELLDIDQLRDIVAEYGMDTGKLVMKWKTKERVIDHIIKIASARANKGDAFR